MSAAAAQKKSSESPPAPAGRSRLAGRLLLLPVLLLPALYFQRLWAEDLLGAILVGVGALAYGGMLFWTRARAFLPLLAIRYLYRRPIAVAAVVAVALCTFVVLVVASIMQGFLTSARNAMHAAKGDLTLRSDFRGFPFYEEFCRRVEAGHPDLIDPATGKPAVARAAPLIYTLGLATIPMRGTEMVNRVQVVGLRPADIAANKQFQKGLENAEGRIPEQPLRVTPQVLEAMRRDRLPAAVIAAAAEMLHEPFAAREGFEFALGARLSDGDLDARRKVENSLLGAAARAALWREPADREARIRQAADHLVRETLPVLAPRNIRLAGKTHPGGGFLVGKEMVSQRDAAGRLHPMLDASRPLRLTMLPPEEAGRMEITNISSVYFQWEGYHRTGVYEQDRDTVYVDFDLLQEKLLMKGDPENGKPPYCHALQIDLAEGVGLDAGRNAVRKAWQKMVDEIETAQMQLLRQFKRGTRIEDLPKPDVGPPFLLDFAEVQRPDGTPGVIFRDLHAGRYRRAETDLRKPAPAGTRVVTVSSTAGFNVGDEILVALGGRDLEHERHVIAEIRPGELILRDPVRNTRGLGAPGEGGVVVATGAFGNVYAQTWEESMQTFLTAVQKEKVMMLTLFGIISMVAVLLVLSIFIQIVKEKTRDIGIIKSVGASAGDVAGVFLLYALCIGLVGVAAGTGLGVLTVYQINEIHDVIADLTGVVMWDPTVYVLQKIPNLVDPLDAAWVAGIGILASTAAAVVPAFLAARLPPVRALAYE